MKDNFGSTLATIIALLLVIAADGRGCMVDGKVPANAAKSSGFKDTVLLHRSDWWAGWNGCSSSDASSFRYRAKNPRDEQVEILVCCGWPMKSCTVRYP